ncbi:helix-turn-helix domain-containing protein [Pseudomonas nabeulensis]|uniref:Helix-turn-helix domain-containing protein n=1 Tax=Pseudomonas nabeulensis TaxID=2293833 RepID=A0A4Z0B3T1_9PSED|nr:helix-turn-helix domain-containing protein [Pseudomonas nabeulensis]TFY92984.1 helix-turn-helix domain-containing protein [Pseudomonas nabeulensis]
MSIQSMVWALEQQEIKDSTCRHVLLCLANYAGSDGRGAFPSALTLATDTGLSERTVRYKLDALEAVGLIKRGNQSIAAAYIDRHDRRPVVYDLIEKRGAPDAPRSERGADEDATGCSSEQIGVQMKTERGAAAAPNTSSIRHLSVNKPIGDKSPDHKGRKSKFDPLTAKPANASDQAWADFCEMRKAKRAPLTLRACELIAKKLANHPEPDAVLNKSTTSSWSDIYPESVLPGAGAKTGKPSAFNNLPNHTPDMYQGGEDGPAF